MINAVFVAVSLLICSVSFAQIGLEDGEPTKEIKIENLRNDKEVVSRVLSKENINWYISNYDISLVNLVKSSLYDAVLHVKTSKEDNFVCDLGLIQKVKENLFTKGLESSKLEVDHYLKLLRSHNLIDDIFLKLLLKLNTLEENLANSHLFYEEPGYWEARPRKFIIRNNNIKDLYKVFETWPDEDKKCLLGSWAKFKKKIYSKVKDHPKSSEIRSLNAYAYKKNIISKEVFQKLEVLRLSEILVNTKIFASGYLNKTFWAKNSMKPKNARRYEIPLERERRFASLKAYRFQDISKREAFYQRYNEDQIVLLAKILKRASIRMGVDPDVQSSVPVIFQELIYENSDGELVTMKDEYRMDNAKDQYEYALRRMRMDLFQTNNYQTLQHLKIGYEDIVMAALETGYITHEEVSIALQYDDLWNKRESKLWKAIKFSVGVGGVAVFYLPPPYNVIGAIGVALINSGFIERKTGEDNDNPNSIFN